MEILRSVENENRECTGGKSVEDDENIGFNQMLSKKGLEGVVASLPLSDSETDCDDQEVCGTPGRSCPADEAEFSAAQLSIGGGPSKKQVRFKDHSSEEEGASESALSAVMDQMDRELQSTGVSKSSFRIFGFRSYISISLTLF